MNKRNIATSLCAPTPICIKIYMTPLQGWSISDPPPPPHPKKKKKKKKKKKFTRPAPHVPAPPYALKYMWHRFKDYLFPTTPLPLPHPKKNVPAPHPMLINDSVARLNVPAVCQFVNQLELRAPATNDVIKMEIGRK